jgi:Skp family chaperone for outer membrane proteins
VPRPLGWGEARQDTVKTRYYTLSLLAAALLASSMAAQSNVNQLSPGDLIKQVIYNELHPTSTSNSHWRYLLEKQINGKQETKAVVETEYGSLDRLLMIDGKPLTSDEDRAETERILRFTRNPEEQRKAQQARRKDAQQCTSLMQVIPAAFIFDYAGKNGNAIKLTFKPNPQFRPLSREGKVLQQMAGEVWVDGNWKRLLSISGHLTDEVRFGGGLLGHLEKGGQFVVRFAEVTPGDWEMTHMVVNMHGKALMFKSISVQQSEVHSEFQQVPDELTLSDAANMLLQQTFVAESWGVR